MKKEETSKTKKQNTSNKKTQTNKKQAKSTLTKKKESSKNLPEKDFKETQILGFHDLPLYTTIFDKVQNPKAVVLIIHGMQEHSERYHDFAKFLNSHGFVVVANDLRGHGHTMQNPDDYGCAEKDFFAEALQDQICVLNYIREKWHLPVYIFSHSYGSFLTQVLVQTSPFVEKAVLCGTTNGSCSLFKMGSLLLSIMRPFNKNDKRGGLAEKLCIKSFGKKFENGNWLTRDESVYEKYQKDKFCGGSFPFSFYFSMIKNMTKINKGVNKIGDKKLFLIAGTADPVGQNGKQVKKLFKIYLKSNIDAKIKLYKDARHELINETNKSEVYKDILEFFEK